MDGRPCRSAGPTDLSPCLTERKTDWLHPGRPARAESQSFMRLASGHVYPLIRAPLASHVYSLMRPRQARHVAATDESIMLLA